MLDSITDSDLFNEKSHYFFFGFINQKTFETADFWYQLTQMWLKFETKSQIKILIYFKKKFHLQLMVNFSIVANIKIFVKDALTKLKVH